MSVIKKIFEEQSLSIEKQIEEFINRKEPLQEEIQAFKALISDPNYEKALFMFYVEILAKAVRKPADFNLFISTLLTFFDTNLSMKNSILILRGIKAIMNVKFYVPLSFYLTKLLSTAISVKNLRKMNRKFDYDHIRISSDEVESEELQMFVIKECVLLIKKHCFSLGSSIGYPEFATVVCNKLRTSCKIGIFKELASDLIRLLTERRTYIEEERNKLKISAMNGKEVLDFESSLQKWSM